MEEDKDLKVNIYTEEEGEEAEEFDEESLEEAEEEKSKDDFSEEKPAEKTSPWRRFTFLFWIIFLIILIGGIFGALVYKSSFTFSKMRFASGLEPGLLPLNQMLPEDDESRENILLLGYRGPDDPNGGLLTDTIIILSIEKSTNQAALISVPRDLYIKIPGTNLQEKINYAYAYGELEKGGQGLLYAKVAIAQVTGLYIDNFVLVNFEAFKELVDALGGITVHLDKPFKEDAQFSKEIIIDLPAGENYLNGDEALYFVRSRYSTSDFDRARRQQQVILAVKDKALSLGVLTNPVKVFSLLEVFGNNVKTDLSLSDIKNLIKLYPQINFSTIKQKVFDTSSQGFLYSSQAENGAYILLPVGGSYAKIQEACQNIFD